MTDESSRSQVKLLSVFNYLRMHHREKRIYDFVVPTVVGVGLAAADYWFAQSTALVWGDAALAKAIEALLLVFTGVFTAAMGVVAALDTYVLRSKLGVKRDGRLVTRRQFMLAMLAYLSTMAFILYCAAVALGTWRTQFAALPIVCRVSLSTAFYIPFAQLGSIALLAMHYLSEETGDVGKHN